MIEARGIMAATRPGANWPLVGHVILLFGWPALTMTTERLSLKHPRLLSSIRVGALFGCGASIWLLLVHGTMAAIIGVFGTAHWAIDPAKVWLVALVFSSFFVGTGLTLMPEQKASIHLPGDRDGLR